MQSKFETNNSNVSTSANLRIAADGFKTLAKNFDTAVAGGNVQECEAALKGLHGMIAFARTFLEMNTNLAPWQPKKVDENVL